MVNKDCVRGTRPTTPTHARRTAGPDATDRTMKLTCPQCEKVLGEEVTPLLVTTSYLTKSIPITGILSKYPSGVCWELDYSRESDHRGELLEYDYECSHCGAVFSEDFIALIFEEGA